MNTSTIIKHILATLFLIISTFALEGFGFICFFLEWGNIFGEADISLINAILAFLIPHLVLLLLNMLFIYVLNKGLNLNKIFYQTWQSIAILLFILPWCFFIYIGLMH